MNEIVFEAEHLELSEHSKDITQQFLESGYFENSTLKMDRFLDADKTIDLEKLELAIILAIGHLEKSVKIENAIYVFLGNMGEYFTRRGIDLKDIEQITEECSFILGFCQAIADEESNDKEVFVLFRGNDA